MPNQPDLTIDLEPLAGFSLDLDQYTGLWAVDETRFSTILEHVSRLDLAAHVRHGGGVQTEAPLGMARDNGITVAVLDIRGVMTKQGSSLSEAGSTVKIRRSIRTLAADRAIDGIILRIDSPGGTVAGTGDLARDVRAAAKQKPVYAFVEDVCASAAYWVASQCTAVYANDATAVIGSIGTFLGLYDRSEQFQKRGVRPVVFRTGIHKGVGFDGEAISDEQAAAVQELIDKTQAEFSAGIASGRNLSAAQVDAIATGQVWTARDAQSHGLIDGIQTFDETLLSIQTMVTSRKRKSTMSQDTTTPDAASAADIRLACPDATDKFILGQVERGATATQVQTAWTAELASQLAQAKADATAAKAQTETAQKAQAQAEATAKQQKPAQGVPPLGAGQADNSGDSGGFDGDPAAEFSSQIRQRVKEGMDRPAAVRAVSRARPDLHRAYLQSTNAAGMADAIASRFE